MLSLSAFAAIGEAVGLALFSVLLGRLSEAKAPVSQPGVLGALNGFMDASPRLFFTLLALTYICRSLLSLLSNYISIANAFKISDTWRLRLIRALLHMPLRAIPAKQGVTLQLVLDEPMVAGSGLASSGILVQNVISAAVIYVTLFWLSATTTMILTCIAIVALLVLMQVFRYSRALGVQRSQAYSEGYGYLAEMVGALRQVRLFGLEGRVEGRLDGLVSRMRSVNRRSIAISSSPRILIELVFVVVFVALLAVLSPQMDQAEMMTAAGLAAVAAMRLLPSFSAAAGIWVQVQQAIPAMRRIAAELSRMEEAVEPPDQAAAVLPPLQRSVELRNVRFAYPERSPALRGLGLEIKAGQFVALVGPSGSGKTTLLDCSAVCMTRTRDRCSWTAWTCGPRPSRSGANKSVSCLRTVFC